MNFKSARKEVTESAKAMTELLMNHCEGPDWFVQNLHSRLQDDDEYVSFKEFIQLTKIFVTFMSAFVKTAATALKTAAKQTIKSC